MAGKSCVPVPRLKWYSRSSFMVARCGLESWTRQPLSERRREGYRMPRRRWHCHTTTLHVSARLGGPREEGDCQLIPAPPRSRFPPFWPLCPLHLLGHWEMCALLPEAGILPVQNITLCAAGARQLTGSGASELGCLRGPGWIRGWGLSASGRREAWGAARPQEQVV